MPIEEIVAQIQGKISNALNLMRDYKYRDAAFVLDNANKDLLKIGPNREEYHLLRLEILSYGITCFSMLCRFKTTEKRIEMALDVPDVDSASFRLFKQQILLKAFSFFNESGAVYSGRELLKKYRPFFETLASKEGLCEFLISNAWNHFMAGEIAECKVQLKEIEEILGSAGTGGINRKNRELKCRLLMLQSCVEFQKINLAAADELIRESFLSYNMNYDHGGGDRKLLASLKRHHGYIRLYQEQYKDASDLFIEALKLDKEISNELGLQKTRLALCALCVHMRKFSDMENYLTLIKRFINETRDETAVLPEFLFLGGEYHLNTGDFVSAKDLFEQTIRVCQQLGDEKAILRAKAQSRLARTICYIQPHSATEEMKADLDECIALFERKGHKKCMLEACSTYCQLLSNTFTFSGDDDSDENETSEKLIQIIEKANQVEMSGLRNKEQFIINYFSERHKLGSELKSESQLDEGILKKLERPIDELEMHSDYGTAIALRWDAVDLLEKIEKLRRQQYNQFIVRNLKKSLMLADQYHLRGWSKVIAQKLINHNEESIDGIALTRFMGHEVSNRIKAKKGEKLQVDCKPERVKCAIMFSDLCGFTSLTKNEGDMMILKVLNPLFDRQIDIIEMDHDGRIDKFIGDGIMTIFEQRDEDIVALVEQVSAEDASRNHPTMRAVDTAIALMNHIIDFNESQEEILGSIKLNLSIGIAYGDVYQTNIGSFRRMQYTALGEKVNLASRLQGKALPGEILTDKAMYDELQKAGFKNIVHVGSDNFKGYDDTKIQYYKVEWKDDDTD